MPTKLFIGVGHYARTGKDTFANSLVERLHERRCTAQRISFASKLKDIAYQLYGWAGLKDEAFYNTREGEELREIKLPALACERDPDGISPREIWIRLGTPAVREQVYQPTWINCVLQTDWGVDTVVIPDVRFPNEVEAIRAQRGILIKVIRPGFKPGDNVADQALVGFDGWDFVLGQTGELQDLLNNAKQFADWIYGTAPKPRQSYVEKQLALQLEADDGRTDWAPAGATKG